MAARPVPLADRLAGKLERAPGGCLVFTGGTDHGGYGHIRAAGRGSRKLRAHRVAYALAHGLDPLELPEELVVRHAVCDNPPCCEERHLAPGDAADNAQDAVEHGRQPVGERHGRATLSDEQVAAVRAAVGSQRAVAAVFGISATHVRHLRQGRYRRAA